MSIHGLTWSRAPRRASEILASALIAVASFGADGEAQERGASGVTRPQQHVPDPVAFAIEMGGGLAGMALGATTGLALLTACMRTEENASLLEDPPSCADPVLLTGAALTLVGGVIGVRLAARATGAPRSTGGAIIGILAGAIAGGLVVNEMGNKFEDSPDVVTVPTFLIIQGIGIALGSRIGGR